MDDLYNKINSLCKKKGISGGKMCADIGLSRSFMTELKMGRSRNISLPTAKKLADYFGVPIETFTDNTNSTDSTESEPKDLTPVEKIQDELFRKRKILFDLSEKATEEDLEKFIKILETIIGEEI